MWVKQFIKFMGRPSIASTKVLDDGQSSWKSNPPGLLSRQHRSNCPSLHGLWRLMHLTKWDYAGNSNSWHVTYHPVQMNYLRSFLGWYSTLVIGLSFLQMSGSQSVSTLWGQSIVVLIYKKALWHLRINYRGISLIPIASNLLSSVILRRLLKSRERLTRVNQAGFRLGRGCIGRIFNCCQVLEHRHTCCRSTTVVFWYPGRLRLVRQGRSRGLPIEEGCPSEV